jgi:hypothetical protein
MTNEKDATPVSPVTAHSPVVQGGEPVEVQAIASLIRGLVEPLARSQQFAESEKNEFKSKRALRRRSFATRSDWPLSFCVFQ